MNFDIIIYFLKAEDELQELIKGWILIEGFFCW